MGCCMIEYFRDFLDNVLGSYSPVSYLDGSGVSVIPAGFSGVDWSYVIAGVLLIVCIYSVFKLIGGVICKMF